MSEAIKRHLSMQERAAISAALPNDQLMKLVVEVAGDQVGDPLHNPHHSAAMREKFGITVELSHKTVFAFNDSGVCAAIPLGEVFRPPAIARRAACVAVASMHSRWEPKTKEEGAAK